jgi:hypothetical protein
MKQGDKFEPLPSAILFRRLAWVEMVTPSEELRNRIKTVSDLSPAAACLTVGEPHHFRNLTPLPLLRPKERAMRTVLRFTVLGDTI